MKSFKIMAIAILNDAGYLPHLDQAKKNNTRSLVLLKQ